MSQLSDKYFTSEELLAIARDKQIPEKYFEAFVEYVENEIRQMTEEGELSVEELGEAAVDFAKVYFDKYELEIQKGHSKEWAELYASNSEEHFHAFRETYQAINKIHPQKAKDELLIHCKAVEADDVYTRYFIELLESGEYYSKDPDTMAADYSAGYKQQLAEGRSELFAHEFASLRTNPDENSEAYSIWYAKTYEECLKKGKPENYSRLFAYKIGRYYSDHTHRYWEIDEDELKEKHEFNERSISAYMTAWEYANEHGLESKDSFIERYKDDYLDTFYADDRDFNISEGEIEKIVLQKATEKHTKFLNKQKNQ